MHIVLTVAAVVALSTSPLAAQGPGGLPGARAPGLPAAAARERQEAARARMRDRLRNTSPEERRAAAERIRDRREGMTPEQRDAARIGARERPRGTPTQAQRDLAQALRDKRRRLREDVKAGKTDRHTAAEELRAWMRDHRPGSGGGEG